MTPAQAAAGIRWALIVEQAGQTYRWTSDGLPLASDDGELAVLGGLDALEVREEMALVGTAADRRSVSVALWWPTSVAEEAVRGLDLTAATGTMYILAGDQAVEDGRMVVSGPLSRPQYGADGESVRLTIGGEPYDDAAIIPDANARIGPGTWAAAPPESWGKWYPTVWGKPGVLDSYGTKAKGSPAYCVSLNAGAPFRLVIAGHKVVATSVEVVYVDPTTGLLASVGPVTIEESVDLLGRTVSTVTLLAYATTDPVRTTSEWWIRWNNGNAIRSPYGSRSLRTMGEVARWLAEQSTIPQDVAAWAAVAQAYPWPCSGWVSEPASPMDILRDQVLPALPVALGWGPRGMRPIALKYNAGPSDVIEHLRAGDDCSRAELVSYERGPEEIAQEIRVGYGGDESALWVTCAADGWQGLDDTSSVWSRAARQRWRTTKIRSKEILSPVIWRRETAARVALWTARVYGASWRSVEYDCGPERAWLDLGDVVWLTDAEIAETQTVAIIVSRTVTIAGAVRLRLMLLPGWDVQQRTTPAGATSDTPVYPPGT